MGIPYERFAGPTGKFAVTGILPGAYTLRAREIGYAPLDTTIVIKPGPGPTTVIAHLRRFAWHLPLIVVEGDCVATGAPDSTINPYLAQIFSQLRVNVDRYRLLLDEYPFRYSREERRFFEQSGQDGVWEVDTSSYESVAGQPYQVGQVIFDAVDSHRQLTQFMYLPSFRDLADSAFLGAHCFSFGGVESDKGSALLRIDFAPANRIPTPDVGGSIYLDAKRYVVRRAEFHLTKPGAVDPQLRGLTATTTFRELFPLVPVLDSVETTRTVEESQKTNQFRVEDDHLLDITFKGRKPGD